MKTISKVPPSGVEAGMPESDAACQVSFGKDVSLGLIKGANVVGARAFL